MSLFCSRQVCSACAYLKKFLRKLEKHLRRGLICEGCEITDRSLLKDNKTKKNKKIKEHIRLVIVSTGVHVAAKIDDEIYVLTIIRIHSYFLFVFSGTKEDRVVENIESDVATLKILATMQKS